MKKEDLSALAETFMAASGRNRVPHESAVEAAVAGMPLYEAPLLGVAAADDPFFAALEGEGAVGPHFLTPEKWLPGAVSVISLFFPASKEVRLSNRASMDWPSALWVHARGEGMDMIDAVNEHLRERLIQAGYQAVSPVRMEQYRSREDKRAQVYTSNWSERHVAYVCALGTFGLSKGLITKKGVAGRFSSIITDLPLEPDTRAYTSLYDYCAMCGACARNCPVQAISLERGKDHVKCSDFVSQTIDKYQPPGAPPRRNRRYGCGKCQVKVPCETGPCRKKDE